MHAHDNSHFDARSPVGRHWLVHGVGFTVCDRDGRRLGVVEHVDVHPLEQRAERVLVRRRYLVRGPRYLVLDPRSVESVLPRSRVFLLPAAAKVTQPAPLAATRDRLGRAARSTGATVRSLGLAVRPVLAELDRRLAVAVGGASRLSRSAATATAEAAVAVAERVRRGAPRVAAWLSARARDIARGTMTVLHLLGAFLRFVARVLADLAVLAAVAVVAAWRSAAAAHASRQRTLADRKSDADAPLARETRAGTSTPSGRRSRH